MRYPYPRQEVVDLFEVVNTYDNNGRAVKATLSCGHKVILTGVAIKFLFVPCRKCRYKYDPATTTQGWKRQSIH